MKKDICETCGVNIQVHVKNMLLLKIMERAIDEISKLGDIENGQKVIFTHTIEIKM